MYSMAANHTCKIYLSMGKCEQGHPFACVACICVWIAAVVARGVVGVGTGCWQAPLIRFTGAWRPSTEWQPMHAWLHALKIQASMILSAKPWNRSGVSFGGERVRGLPLDAARAGGSSWTLCKCRRHCTLRQRLHRAKPQCTAAVRPAGAWITGDRDHVARTGGS